ncbi:MAG: hypothetical protein V4443_12480 [Pseudomonadota bacterium]
MPRKTLLYLAADHFHARTWSKGKLSEPRNFADTATGREEFSAFLLSHRAPAYLLTDLIEEDFRVETIPHLRNKERAEMIQRKLKQYYRDTSLHLALPLQRQKTGRRDDNILLCALTNPALLAPWLAVLQQRGTLLAGIYSISGISAQLLKDHFSERLLLLSWEHAAGLRQTYFSGGQLRFSRLSPLGGSQMFHDVIATELARTRQYLYSLNLLSIDQALDVLIICSPQDQPELKAQLRDSADLRYAYLDIQPSAQKPGPDSEYFGADATPLFLRLLAAHPPARHYAAAEHVHFFRLFRIRRGLRWLGVLVLSASLVWSTTTIDQENRLLAANLTLHSGIAFLTSQKHQIDAAISAEMAGITDMDKVAHMKNAVLLTRDLRTRFPSPRQIFSSLSKTLEEFPALQVNKLAWQVPPPQVLPTPAAMGANTPEITLHGELQNFAGNRRATLDYLERFQQTLRQRGHLVTALAMPLDLSPQGRITADANDSAATSSQFELKISWRPLM